VSCQFPPCSLIVWSSEGCLIWWRCNRPFASLWAVRVRLHVHGCAVRQMVVISAFISIVPADVLLCVYHRLFLHASDAVMSCSIPANPSGTSHLVVWCNLGRCKSGSMASDSVLLGYSVCMKGAQKDTGATCVSCCLTVILCESGQAISIFCSWFCEKG
jgi:hypothetical protein